MNNPFSQLVKKLDNAGINLMSSRSEMKDKIEKFCDEDLRSGQRETLEQLVDDIDEYIDGIRNIIGLLIDIGDTID